MNPLCFNSNDILIPLQKAHYNPKVLEAGGVSEKLQSLSAGKTKYLPPAKTGAYRTRKNIILG